MSDEQDIVWLGKGEALVFPPAGSAWARKGWAAYFSDAVGRAYAQVFLRFGLAGNIGWKSVDPGEANPLIVRELLVRGGGGGGVVTAALVREVPLARLEAAANRRLARLPRPEPGDFPFLNQDDATRAPHFADDWATRPSGDRRSRGPSLRLRIPSDRRKPDEFYEQVAERFLWLTERGRKPAVELAAANPDVPVTTVHRWVKEARRRGILPAARRGDGSTPQEEEE